VEIILQYLGMSFKELTELHRGVLAFTGMYYDTRGISVQFDISVNIVTTKMKQDRFIYQNVLVERTIACAWEHTIGSSFYLRVTVR
jgi:hypothetical protein